MKPTFLHNFLSLNLIHNNLQMILQQLQKLTHVKINRIINNFPPLIIMHTENPWLSIILQNIIFIDQIL